MGALLPTAVATATCGGGGGESENPQLTVSPNPINFSGQGSKKTATIQNTGNVTLKNIATAINPFEYFAPSGAFTCHELPELTVGAACFESVECLKTGKSGLLQAWGEPPKGTSAEGFATLKC
ncbi:MAG TPA: hypothetical protein VF093_05845 [Solirubrobacterales bacterium]